MDLPCSRRIDPFRQSPRTAAYGYFAYGTVPHHHPYSLSSCAAPATSARRLPQATRLPITRSHRFPGASGTTRRSDSSKSIAFHFALAYRVAYPTAPGTLRGLPRSRTSLPHRAVRTHLGTRSGRDRLRLHSAGSTLPPLWPTGSSSGQPPSTTARCFSASPSDSRSRGTPCPPFCSKGQRGITPAFGYGAPRPSATGTLTLLTRALLGAHYGLS